MTKAANLNSKWLTSINSDMKATQANIQNHLEKVPIQKLLFIFKYFEQKAM